MSEKQLVIVIERRASGRRGEGTLRACTKTYRSMEEAREAVEEYLTDEANFGPPYERSALRFEVVGPGLAHLYADVRGYHNFIFTEASLPD